LQLRNVSVTRGGREILSGVDVAFEPGRRYVVIGPSGSGKSTLARLLDRLDDPSSGDVCLGKTSLASMPVQAVRSGVGMVFQAALALEGSVGDNLAYPFQVHGQPRPSDRALSGWLEEVGLDPGWIGRDARGLSGGERQRLAIARALTISPEILVLDEPTSALDPVSARRVADLLERECEREGLRTITICHQREHARWLGDRAVVVESGKVVDEGPVGEMLARHEADVEV
jgi:ABC-type methionine transport system ATPase subunit